MMCPDCEDSVLEPDTDSSTYLVWWCRECGGSFPPCDGICEADKLREENKMLKEKIVRLKSLMEKQTK